MGKALREMRQRQLRKRIGDAFFDVAAGDLPELEPVRDVVVYRLVRP